MKKKLLSTIALATCFVMGMGAFTGCQFMMTGNSGSSQSESGGSGNLTQQQIYDEVLEAVEATKTYTGEYTITATNKYERKDGAENHSSNTEQVVSADPAANKMYEKQTRSNVSGQNVSETESTAKLFKENNQYYGYESYTSSNPNSSAEPTTDDGYVKVSERIAKETLAERSVGVLADSVVERMESVGLIEGISVSEVNAVWAEVFADSKAQVAAGATDEESKWYNSTADGSVAISCTENNGAYTVAFTLNVEMTEDKNENKANSVMTVTAKDGKLSTVSMIQTDEAVRYNTSDTVSEVKTERTSESESTYTFSYEFDQAGYDAITTTLPDSVEEEEEYYEKGILAIVNGVEVNEVWAEGETVKEALTDFAEDWSFEGMNVTWYTDQACTKALDIENATEAQFDEMITLYGKATAKEGYVFVKTTKKYEYTADVPEAYKTIFNLMDVMSESSSLDAHQRSVESLVNLNNFLSGVEVKRTLNGTETTSMDHFEQIVARDIETAELFDIQHTYILKKTDCNIFGMLF